MADQLQLRGGTTSEHSTFTGALREVTVDTDKDTVVVHDGSTAGGRPLMREDGSNSALALGSQGSPSLKFTGDTNTGIYSPGADQVAISTGGSGRLFVDSSGNVGIGASSITNLANYAQLVLNDSNGGFIDIEDDGVTQARIIGSGNELTLRAAGTGGAISFDTDGSNERLRITATGELKHIGGGSSGSPGVYFAGSAPSNSLYVENTTGHVGLGTNTPGAKAHIFYTSGLPVTSGTTQTHGALRFGASGTNGVLDIGNAGASGSWLQATNQSSLIPSNSFPLLLNPNGGNVGIGTSSVTRNLVVRSTGQSDVLISAGTANYSQLIFGDTDAEFRGAVGYNHSNDSLILTSAGSPAVTINSSQSVGIGTGTPNSKLSVVPSAGTSLTYNDYNGDALYIQNENQTNSSGSYGGAISWGRSGSTIIRKAAICSVQTTADQDPTGLAFLVSSSNSTLGNMSEAVRIDENGNVGIGTTSPAGKLDVRAGTNYHDPRIILQDSNGDSDIQIGTGSGVYWDQSERVSLGLQIRSNRLYGNTYPITFWTGTAAVGGDLSTGGESMRIDTSGRLLVGASSSRIVFGGNANTKLLVETSEDDYDTCLALAHNQNTGANAHLRAPVISLSRTRGTSNGSNTVVQNGDALGYISFEGADGTNTERSAEIKVQVDGTPGSNDMPGRIVFSTTPAGDTVPDPRMTIKSDGKVGIGTESPNQLLHVSGSANDAITNIVNTDATNGYGLSVAAGGSASGRYIARFADASNNGKVIILSDGSVGIGTTSPSNFLHIKNDTTANTTAIVENTTVGNAGINLKNASGDWQIVANANLRFIQTGTGDRVNIDSNGRLLVGTSSALSNVKVTSVAGNSPRLQLQGQNDNYSTSISATNSSNSSYGPAIALNASKGTQASPTAVVNNGDFGFLTFNGYDGTNYIPGAHISARVDGTPGTNDMPGRLVFATTADGASSPTERMRIDNGGNIYFNTTSTPDSSTSGFFFTSTGRLIHYSTTAYGNSRVFEAGGIVGYARIMGDGDLENSNNSYGAISDIKLKENIVDANSQWDDLKTLQVRNYNFKSETGYGTHTQIGLIAQEVELVSPGLVGESIDEETGESTKSVNYSVLYMKAVKALQEAMERIEVLEAKVAALEGA